MNTDLSVEALRQYLRILDNNEDAVLDSILKSAISYVENHTGLSEYEVVTREDLKRVIFIVCSDFYWNRDYQTNNKYTNRLVDSILENNRINFFR